jgi:seryl-tRNA(Sec) selenium transferase
MNIALLKRTMANYTNPKRANIMIVEELCRTHNRLRSQLERLSNEVRAQKGQSGYQVAQYSRKNFPKTFGYFDADPDVRSAMRKVILTYQPQEEVVSA